MGGGQRNSDIGRISAAFFLKMTSLRNLMKKGKCNMGQKEENKVINQNGEVKMINKRNRKQIQFKT